MEGGSPLNAFSKFAQEHRSVVAFERQSSDPAVIEAEITKRWQELPPASKKNYIDCYQVTERSSTLSPLIILESCMCVCG